MSRRLFSLLSLSLLPLATACVEEDKDDDDEGEVDEDTGEDDTDTDSDTDTDAPADDDGDTFTADEDCDDGDATVHPGAPEVGDDADVDEDCDGDADEADSGIDTCEVDWTGTYTGTFEVVVTETVIGLSDTCSGTAAAYVDPTDTSDPVSVDVSCSFSGIIASLFPGAQSGTFYGAFDSEDEVSGGFGVASIITDTWEGTFTAPDTFEGTFSGSTTYSGYSLSYTGTISTQR